MDNLPLYYDPSDTMYHILEDNDSGVGADDLPFAAYSGTLYESENPSPPSNQSFQTVFVRSIGNQGYDGCHDNDDDDGDDEEENDLEYVDDEQDYDYRPNKTALSKKGKGRLKKYRHLKTIDMTGMFTPPKKTEKKMDELSGTRHYAHKDRTPRTILKMMEKHRESERVRHHTLNESMKTICSRVPGYDPNAKETKVIQMQRIIGYECFLENTINNLCEQIGIKKKLLGINTNFITEAMKDKKPEDWFKLDPIEVPMMDEEDSLLESSSIESVNKYVRKTSVPRHFTNYRREKISSPTVDSTTDNIIQLFPGRASATSQRSESSLDGSWVSQGFRPIQESQESGIKTETQTTVGDCVFQDTIDCLFEQELCSEAENLKTVTATFMNDEVIPSSTSVDDATAEFNLSSPLRYSTNKVFLQSPKSSGLWHQPLSLYHSDTSEILGSTEMTSISPEFILETKPKEAFLELNEESRGANSDFGDFCTSELQMFPTTPPTFHTENYLIEEPFKTTAPWSENPHTPSNLTGSKNKRKRYTPVRAPFKNISNVANNDETYYDGNKCGNKCAKIIAPFKNISNFPNNEEPYYNDGKFSKKVGLGKNNVANSEVGYQDSEKCTKKVVKIFKHLGCSIVKDGVQPPFIVISTRKENHNAIENLTVPLGNALQEEVSFPTNKLQSDNCPAITACVSALSHRGAATSTATSAQSGDQSFSIGQSPNKDQRRSATLNVTRFPLIGQQRITSQSAAANHRPQRLHHPPTSEHTPVIDHRRTTWMNGFMMYSRINRSKFLSSYPGLQSSQIQRLMGETWRNMSSHEQQPYREKARNFSEYMKKAESQDSGYHGYNGSDRLVPSSTTDDLECIIAGL